MYEVEKVNIDDFADNLYGSKTKFIRSLDVGDSFVAPKEKRMFFSSIARQIGYKLSTRKVDDLNVRIVRVKQKAKP